ncbi:transcription factor FER-LIKE IRON DEFICIENCY-INDUCED TRANSCRIPTION FACTOR [Euphorbia lathyris]|uniref:transcription factor FER-LIKE IRON DEFICIENCY-INDUCED TRANSCRIPTION FACTOR n=1 Tax=Euphorbia lathyris TaxID=212925 RepID=UPI0033130DE4
MDMNTHQLFQTNDLELYDFTGDANFDQFINQIRGQNEEQICGYDFDLFNTLLDVDNHHQFAANNPLPLPADENVFNFGAPATICADSIDVPVDHQTSLAGVPVTFSSFVTEGKGEDEDLDGEEDNSSGTTTTPGTKSDRSRTLMSERKRRGRMKEKLYALRSLVPNITKMDKASIIGDAVLYVQELQMQAKKLKSEILGLETSLVRSERFQDSNRSTRKNVQVLYNANPCNKIMQMDVFQVEEREFYVKLVCNKGDGVASSLYRTLESLTSFKVQSSNMASLPGKFILTFNLRVKDSGKDMNLPNLKLWITGALLNQGFEFLTSNLCA